jgi:hypothetical protein
LNKNVTYNPYPPTAFSHQLSATQKLSGMGVSMYVRVKKAKSGNLASNVVKGCFRSNDLADVGVNIGISLATNIAGNQIQKNTTVSKFNSTVTASTSSAGGKIPTSGLPQISNSSIFTPAIRMASNWVSTINSVWSFVKSSLSQLS